MEGHGMSADTDRLQAGFTTREIRIPTGTVVLEGVLATPDDPEALVLVVHVGMEPSVCAHLQTVADILLREGFSTLVFGLLTPEEFAEQGPHLQSNIGLLKQRLVCAAHWVTDEDEARHLRIGILGSGTGGAAGLVAAADLGRFVGALVLCGGRPDLAGNALRRVQTPALLIAGGLNDEEVEFNQDAYDMLKGEKELIILPSANDLLQQGPSLEDAAHLAADWFHQHLQAFSSGRFVRGLM
jgi:putative phosphoribosyl transferase